MAEAMNNFDIVPTSLAVRAMRDNGYKNTAYAVAELMDNSIQAGASIVQLLCSDREGMVRERKRTSLERIAVLDNGSGMDRDTLRIALQFGNGTRLDQEDWDGMGRFGMGLPSASISQSRRVDVWSWQDGPESALHSYIDLDEIESGTLSTMPDPSPDPMPPFWRQASDPDGLGQTGTLVVWSSIDRSLWRTSKALISNSERLIGRMYRKWIHDGRVRLRLASFTNHDSPKLKSEADALANDPLYLMAGTSCPVPDEFSEDETLFQPFPDAESYELRTTIGFQGKEHEVVTRFALARESARKGKNAGSKPWGKHAAKNVGVSIVRAGRELDLDQGWTNSYDPRERWWGVEVCFEPGLDELFGVSNNKQAARHFSEAAQIDTKGLAKAHGGSITQARLELEDDEDPTAPLLELVSRIRQNIELMRAQIARQKEGSSRRRHEGASIEEEATRRVRSRQEHGHRGRSDEDEVKPRDEREKALADELAAQGHSPETARELAGSTIDKGLKYRVEPGSIDGHSFFSVQPRGGVILVTLNTEHPAYELLLGAQDPDELPDSPNELKERLLASQAGLEMMLLAWARYEDEQIDSEMRRNAQNARYDWGRMADVFLREDRDV